MKPITTINLHLYGLGSDTQRVEARRLEKGFSVILVPDEEVSRQPFRVGHTERDYNWRELATIVCQIKEGLILPEMCKKVTVCGESGIRAEMLILAWSYCEGDQSLIDWLMAQSDASLDYIEQGIGSILEEDAQALLAGLADTLFDLYGDRDLGKLIPLHSDLHELYYSVLEEQEQGRLRRADKLSPFKDDIDEVMNNWAKQHPFKGGMNAQMGYGARRGSIRRYIQNWVLEYSEMPKGVHDLGFTDKWNVKTGEIDFDGLSTGVDN